MAKKTNGIDYSEQTMGKMAALYRMDGKTFKKNIKKIRPRLDKIAGREKYSRLTPIQVELIIAHLGEP
ncbi:MAG: DUF4248 domain-containing protein [Bacteroidetes bacterium]|nr:DUF4248 domain-containing protein [Bacteroidota bacterium]